MRSLADIEDIERVPLDQRIRIDNFSRRVALALEARAADEIAIHYVPDGDVGRDAEGVSFGELKRNIAGTAALLASRGIGRSDVVAVLMPAVPAVYWSILGAMAAAVAFPVNWMLEPKYVLGLLKEANVRAVVALGPTPGFQIWESLMQIAADLPPGTQIWSVAGPGGAILPDSDLDTAIGQQPGGALWPASVTGNDIAALVHSGGTTGLPKIVKLSHRNMSYRHWTTQLAQQLVFGEVILHDTPMFHVGGLIGRILPPLASGASVLIPTVLGARDKRYIANYWRFAEKYRLTRLSAVPTTLAVLAKSPPVGVDLSSLRPNFITGSTSLPVSVQRRFEEISGVRVLNSYGMTENTASIAVDPRDGSRKEGGSGLRAPYTQVRTVAVSGPEAGRRLCGTDEIGMLQIRGPGQAAGYLNPAHGKDGRTDDGWTISGDLGRIDGDGFIFVTGRAKDIIIRGGHNIDPSLIEEPLLQFPDVVHAAAVGKPDSHAGELPVAYVQLVPGSKATPDEIAAFLEPRIAERAAMPKEIIVLDSLPLTNVGKPLKSVLRQDIAERTFRKVLADTTGLSCEQGQLRVAVEPHPTRGVVVSIAITGVDASARAEHSARIAEAMDRYSMAYSCEWR
ncbi:MAG: acyl-CoA synthetase [Xanthobacteraceae bacterium]|nr:acyl-CoA synthetase [Xanthobacteraceae bacterium]